MKSLIKTIGFIALGLVGFLTWLFVTASFASTTDPRIHVAIIDTGTRAGHDEWYCKDAPPKDFTGVGIYDANGHGTNIAGIIASYLSPQTHCLMIIKWFHSNKEWVFPGPAIEYAYQHGAKYINLSFYGPQKDLTELNAIYDAISHGVKVIVAAGNDHRDLTINCYAYPACYHFYDEKNFYVVADTSPRTGNYGGPVDHYEDGTNVSGWELIRSGSSQATAIFTGKLAKSEAPSRHY